MQRSHQTQLGINWTTYFFCASLAILLSWALSGCRFGNRVEFGIEETEKLTGIYETQAQSYEVCSVLENPGDPQNPIETCALPPTNTIPALITDIMTNPVVVQLIDAATGDAQIYSPYPGSTTALPVFGDTTKFQSNEIPLSLIGSNEIALPWQESECQLTFGLDESGTVHRASELGDLNGFTTTGTLELSVIVSYLFSGNCTATLNYMESCYSDIQNCQDPDHYDFIEELLAPMLENNLISNDDISDLRGYAYEVSYQ